MISIVATGVGVLASPGIGRDAFAVGMRSGGAGPGETPWAPAAGLPRLAFRLPAFDPRTWIAAAALRRLDRTGILAIAAAKLAIADADLRIPPHRIGVVLGAGGCGVDTTTGFHRRLVETAGTDPNPMAFPNTVPNAAAGQVSIACGLTGFNTTLVQTGGSGEEALALAADLLRAGRLDAVLAGGVDELAPLIHHTLGRLGGLDPGGCRPFDASARGTVLAEDAALLVLERAEDAARRGARPLAELAGAGEASSPARPLSCGPASAAAGAMKRALDAAGVRPGDIAWVSSAACGTTDARCAEAIAAILPGAAVSSVGGACGEGLAIGGVRAAAAVLACAAGEIWGSPWVRTPSCGLDIAREVRPLRGAVLQHGAGTGGRDLALVWRPLK